LEEKKTREIDVVVVSEASGVKKPEKEPETKKVNETCKEEEKAKKSRTEHRLKRVGPNH